MTSLSVCRKCNLHKHPPLELIKVALIAFTSCYRSIGTVTSDAANVNTISILLQQENRKRVTVSLFFGIYSRMRDDTDLAGALGAAVHRPFILVLVHNAIVDAHSTLVFQQCAFLRLKGEGGMEREEKGVDQKDGKLSLCQSSSTNESLTDSVIKTLPDSSEAAQVQATANQRICVFTWVSLRFWPQAVCTVTSGYAQRIL